MDKLQNFLRPFVVCAVFVNLWLFGFAFISELDSLSILAILNLILLSFSLLYEKKE